MITFELEITKQNTIVEGLAVELTAAYEIRQETEQLGTKMTIKWALKISNWLEKKLTKNY